MARIDESGLPGQVRDQPIASKLRTVLLRAAEATGVDVVYIVSGGQPGSTGGRKGSTRHDRGRAADLKLIVAGQVQSFSDSDGGDVVSRFVTAAAANGATGIGAGVHYMGPQTLHIGFGLTENDHSKVVWGADKHAASAPGWLKRAASLGWRNPPPDWVFPDPTPARSGWDDDQDDEDERPSWPIATSNIEVPSRFTYQVIRAALASQAKYGIPASVTLAQWALESAYGRRTPPGSNNPFGIKAKRGASAGTKEFINGRWVSPRATFRIFASLDEAFEGHGRLLANGKPYERARRFLSDPDRFADALTGVYATDPQYGSKLKRIMRENDLYRFDRMAGLDEGPVIDVEPEVEPSLDRDDLVDPIMVRALQERLVALGYSLGKIDGKFGTLTAGALLAFQRDAGVATSGLPDAATLTALRNAERRRLGDDRVRATEKDLAEAGSQIVVDAGRSRMLSWLTGILGALGIGNSAILGAAGTTQPRVGTVLPDTLLPFLGEVQRLQRTSPQGDFQRVGASARSLLDQLGGSSLPTDVVQLVEKLRGTLPADVLTRNPDILRAFDTIGKAPPKPSSMSTIFDILPTFFANDTVLQTIMKGVALTAGSVLPGVGGSAAILGIGLLGRLFANRIASARVKDHQDAVNLKSFFG